MVDLHSHILNDIDDGSKSLQDSLEILRKYLEEGIKKVVLTPHYIENSKYNIENKEKIELFNKLNEEVRKQNIDIELYLGNEVYVASNIIELLKNNKIMTINNSRYILIELNMINEDPNVKDIIYNLRLDNIIPIIAHPERYEYIKKDIKKAKQLVNYGALLQINKDSLFGKYGKEAEKTAKKLVKNKLVHFVGTDIHSLNGKLYSISKFKKLLYRLGKREYIDEILEENSIKVLNNEEIK